MAHIVVTFLGAPSSNYKLAEYEFEHGKIYSGTIFGLTLLQHLQESAGRDFTPPSKIIFIGTSGSGWAHLTRYVTNLGEDDALIEDLRSKAKGDSVSEADLAPAARLLAEKLSVEVRLVRIPYGENLDEQIGILQRVAQEVEEDDIVTIDFTLGLRHLPAHGLLAALFLELVKRARVREICYGAFDMKARHAERAPVVKLGGLLHAAEWLQALHAFDTDSDYSVFVPLLEKDGVAGTAELRRAALLERLLRFGEAHTALQAFQKASGRDWPRLSGLFEESLRKRLEETAQATVYQRQRRLALHHLEWEDPFRAVVIGFEAFVTRLVLHCLGDDGESVGYKTRDDVRRQYAYKLEQLQKSSQSIQALAAGEQYKKLTGLRNTLVHLDQPKNELADLANREPEQLTKELDFLLRTLLPEEPKAGADLPDLPWPPRPRKKARNGHTEADGALR